MLGNQTDSTSAIEAATHSHAAISRKPIENGAVVDAAIDDGTKDDRTKDDGTKDDGTKDEGAIGDILVAFWVTASDLPKQDFVDCKGDSSTLSLANLLLHFRNSNTKTRYA